MKSILPGVALTLTHLLVAQSSYTVINGYTLEPLDSVTIAKDSIAATISRTGFVSKTVSIDQFHYGQGLMIILQPTSERLKEEHRGIKYYGEPIKNTSTDIYDDNEPEFPGGRKALMQYFAAHVRYPQDALDYEISGKVYVQFIVTAEGSIAHIIITRGLTRSIDAECVRVMQEMPKWKPALIKGKAVNQVFQLPISFSLP